LAAKETDHFATNDLATPVAPRPRAINSCAFLAVLQDTRDLEKTDVMSQNQGRSGNAIIAVTSYALSGEEKKVRAAGCDDYVLKPFSPHQLLAKIRQCLS
jgi:CheY-like chemotaxis protein